MVEHLALGEHTIVAESSDLQRGRVVRTLGEDEVIDPASVLDGPHDEEPTTGVLRRPTTEAALLGLRVSPWVATSVAPHAEAVADPAGGEVPAHGLCKLVPKDWAAQPDRSS